MHNSIRLSVALLLAFSTVARAQNARLRPLSLPEALDQALERNSSLSVAEARRDIAGSESRKAGSPLWPNLYLEGGFLRSTDPVVAFGTKLRQGRFGPEDLAFEALNHPDAISDWSTAVALRWNLLDPTVWAGRSVARRQAEAGEWSAERTREATILITQTLYYRAQTAAAQREAARSALEAADATLQLFRRRRDRGLLTDADLLQAEAELAAAQAQAVESEQAWLDSLLDLGAHLGWPADSLPSPSDSMAEPTAVAREEFDPRNRADIQARAAVLEAAGAARGRATWSYVPALEAFARYGTHGADPLTVNEDNWTVGLVLRWTVFAGFGRSADVQRARLERRIAEVEYEQAVRDAQAEVDRALRALDSALQRIEATRAAQQAAESGRVLMRRRFEEGLATAADLLQAESRATAMRQSAINALATYHMAVAKLEYLRSQSNREAEQHETE